MSSGMSNRKLSVALVFGALIALVANGPAYSDGIFSPTQQQLFEAEDVTALFGGNGQVLSRRLDGAGVLYEIEGGTIDFGKVGLRIPGPGDLSDFDAYGLRIDVVTAARAVEINSFIQTGDVGQAFFEDEPGVKVEGDSFDSMVSFEAVSGIDNVFGFGFQYFTAGDILEPPAQVAYIRITPIPEVSSGILIAVGLSFLALRKRR